MALNRQLVRIYEDLEIEAGKRLRNLKLTDVQPKVEDYPCLRHQKGAQIRAFGPVCEELCKLYCSGRTEKHRLAMVQSLNRLYTQLETPWQEWTEKVGKEWMKEVNKMMAHYSFLAVQAMGRGETLYSLAQKHHVLLHLGEQAIWLHPKTTWCYGSES